MVKKLMALYRKYSTKAVAHTIKTYSKFTIPFPYPVAQSVEACQWNGIPDDMLQQSDEPIRMEHTASKLNMECLVW